MSNHAVQVYYFKSYICRVMSNSPETGKKDKSPAVLNCKDWVSLYADYLYNYAAFRVNDEEEAQDLVQETFLSGLKAKENFRGECSEKTWLITILKRKIIDHYRKKATQSIGGSLDSGQVAAGYGEFFQEDGDYSGHWKQSGRPQMWDESTFKSMDTKEFYQVLHRCLAVLPDKWATIFKLKNMEDLETEEICKECKVSASNYWIIMHRAKLQLRKCMELNWFGKGE